MKRTKAVLFAIFRPEDAYLLDLVDHGSGQKNAWTRRHILEIMAREWPEAQLLLELKGVLPGADYDEGERGVLRKAGAATSVAIDGKVYVSRSPLSTAGTSSLVSMEGSRILNHVRSMERDLREGAGPTWNALLKTGRLPRDLTSIRFTFDARGYGLLDDAGKIFFRMAG